MHVLSAAVRRLAVLGLAVKYPRNARQKAAQKPIGIPLWGWVAGTLFHLLCAVQAVRFYIRHPTGDNE